MGLRAGRWAPTKGQWPKRTAHIAGSESRRGSLVGFGLSAGDTHHSLGYVRFRGALKWVPRELTFVQSWCIQSSNTPGSNTHRQGTRCESLQKAAHSEILTQDMQSPCFAHESVAFIGRCVVSRRLVVVCTVLTGSAALSCTSGDLGRISTLATSDSTISISDRSARVQERHGMITHIVEGHARAQTVA